MTHSRAYWLTPSLIAWSPPASAAPGHDCRYELRSQFPGTAPFAIGFAAQGSVAENPALAARYPYLAKYRVLAGALSAEEVLPLLKTQLTFSVSCAGFEEKTGVQLHPVIDEIATYGGDDLGVRFNKKGVPVFKLWAPTARSVTLHVFAQAEGDSPVERIAMSESAERVWHLDGRPEWRGMYYLYEVEVVNPLSREIERNLVTDPYSLSLSANSKRSFIVDLEDRRAKPRGWDGLQVQGPEKPEDITLYELHVRDFSMNDLTVPEEARGKYVAFAESRSQGARHLRELAEAGLSHVHLLPAFDFGSVNEKASEQVVPAIPPGLPADSAKPAQEINRTRERDGFNWGYDPLHYLAPEGSYATDPDGLPRIFEFRKMIQGLETLGLHAVMDVVFNHTYKGPGHERSVLDQVVPGYFHRTDRDGKLQSTSCGPCADTASERVMMEKLMVDAITLWARHYKVAGFRFDLMGFHTIGNLRAVRASLDRLSLEKDGIDGRRIYLYGEGWKFGSLEDILPGQTATQMNVAGVGVGTFNDRLRDRARGGNFNTSTKTDQGFVTGLYYDDNGIGSHRLPPHPPERRRILLEDTDVIRLSLAGNLADFRFQNCQGRIVTGRDVPYGGAPAGYTTRPGESINYISAHDNYDLWDQIAAKAPFEAPQRIPRTATIEERVRMQKLGLALVAFAQGVPFFHAGSEILRSKSGDNNSYDSGDWFNRLDFSLTSNNWGVGLPPGENTGDWEFWAPRLRAPELMPAAQDIESTFAFFKALLRIRRESPLLRLSSAEEVQMRLRFLETDLGENQPPGVVVLALRDSFRGIKAMDSDRKLLLVTINATRAPVEFTHSFLRNRKLTLHPEWNEGVEPRTSLARYVPANAMLSLPPQTVLVWEERRTK